MLQLDLMETEERKKDAEILGVLVRVHDFFNAKKEGEGLVVKSFCG
jgi:hypothetical protein